MSGKNENPETKEEWASAIYEARHGEKSMRDAYYAKLAEKNQFIKDTGVTNPLTKYGPPARAPSAAARCRRR